MTYFRMSSIRNYSQILQSLADGEHLEGQLEYAQLKLGTNLRYPLLLLVLNHLDYH